MEEITMAQTTTLSEIQKKIDSPVVRVGFDTVNGFEAMQRMAKLFTSSSIVPDAFRGNSPTNQGNAVIALDMALRMGANPLMVMQNLYVVHGRPAWSAQFLIATLNQSGRFSALRYEFQGKEDNDDWGCRAVATELSSGEKLSGPLITIGLAKKEGWYSKKDKNGRECSKWQTMPELMLRYRAASWFVRAYAPEIAMGLQTADEVADTFDLEQEPSGVYGVTVNHLADTAVNQENSQTGGTPAEDVEMEMSVATEPEQTGTDTAPTTSQDLIECPNRGGKMIEEWECAGCANRNGCPSWE